VARLCVATTHREIPRRRPADALGLSEEERSSLLALVPARAKTAAKGATSASALGATLPSPPTPLLGRQRELTEIRELLLGGSAVRLLTLTGIGGVVYGADVAVTVALRGAAVGGLVGSLIRVQWLVSTPGGECLAAMFVVLLAVAKRG
jgi:hypothetical protein